MAKYEKKYDYVSELSTNWSFDLSQYIDDILKAIPASVRVGIKLLLSTGDYYIDGSYICKKWITTNKEHYPIERVRFPEQPISNTAIADQLIGKNINYPPLMLESADSLSVEPKTSDEIIGKPKQKRNKGMNMKGIKKEMRFWEMMYEFIHTDWSIEFLPKDIREQEKNKQDGKEIKIEPVSIPKLNEPKREPKETHEPDTSKYDVINPMIMVLNSFEKEQFRIRLKYTYNHNEQVIEERLSKLMLSTDQEYVMNQKLDLLERYEEDQKKRKEIENYDFFSDDKKDDTKKK